MATNTAVKPAPSPKGKELQKNGNGATGVAVPDYLKDQIKGDAGKGVSTAQEDNLVPLIYVLQGLSPQANKRGGDYIDGAEPGHIWLRNAPDPIVAGDEGIIFQPCYFGKDWVEWVPRDDGGGLIGRHDERPEEAVETPDTKDPNVVRWMLPNGNEVKETRYHTGFVITDHGAMPYVIPFSGSGHSVSKAWMYMMNSRLDASGNKVPAFACTYKLTTKQRKNKKGEWFVFEPSFHGFVPSLEDYRRGKDMFEAFASGALKRQIDEPDTGNAPRGGDDNDAM